jgi:hypothetical protein
MHNRRTSHIVFFVCGTILLNTILVWQAHNPSPIALPAPHTLTTTIPKAGVHTRLSGVADRSYITQQLDLVHELGTPWIVELFPWAYAQPRSAYGYDWSGFDTIIDQAHRRGVHIIARLDIVPAWARPSGSTDRLLLPSAYADYRAYVVAFVTRYHKRGVSHIILWNEPNLRFEWGGRTPDPEAYATLISFVAPAVKTAAPNIQILAGGLSPGESLGDNAEVRLGDKEYTERFFAAGGGSAIDGWAVHAYGAQRPPNDLPKWDVVNLRRVELVHALVATYREMPIYITESGWNDHSRCQSAVTAAERIRWSRGAYTYAQQTPWIACLVLWQFGLAAPTHTYQDGWVIIAGDGTPRAIFYELKALLNP